MNMGQLRQFIEANKDLPDDFPLVGLAHQYDYPTDVTMKFGKWNDEDSEWGGDTPCVIVSCEA